MSLSRHLALAAPVLAAAGAAAAQPAPTFLNPPTLSAPRGYSHVAVVPPGSRLVYVSGQVPLDKDGKLVGPGDIRVQAEQVFSNLKLALAAAGASFADVVKINWYVTDTSKLQDLRDVRDKFVNTANPPASTLVEVRRLFREDVLVEVEAVAAIPDRPATAKRP